MTISEKIISGRGEPIPAFLPEVELRIFASAECGATAMTTGTATFAPGASLEYHTHPCSEAVTVLQGEGLFSIEGRAYRLRPLDCIHVPAGVAHSVTNRSNAESLAALSAFA